MVDVFKLEIRKKKRDFLSEKRESGMTLKKRESGMTLKKREFTPESGSVDTYGSNFIVVILLKFGYSRTIAYG